MKKILTTTALAVSLCAGATFPASAETVVGTVKFWQYMQADGWKSADGMDNDALNNTLYQASVIGNYPLDQAIPAASAWWRCIFSRR